MSCKNVFACNFQLKMRIQLKLFQQYLNISTQHNKLFSLKQLYIHVLSLQTILVLTYSIIYESLYVL